MIHYIIIVYITSSHVTSRHVTSLGVCKKPEPFQMVFPGVIFFFLLSFSQALASHLDQRIHMSEEREKEERKRNKKAVSHTDHFWRQKLSFSLKFVIVRESCVFSFFPANDCNHQKRSVATTYQAPSLCRICAITTTNKKKRPKALNSRRMMEKSRTLDFKSLDTDHYYNQRYRVFSLLSCFRVKAKNGSWGIMED